MFNKGDLVVSNTGLFEGTRTVRNGSPDDEGDVTLNHTDKNDWFYAPAMGLSYHNPKVVKTDDVAEAYHKAYLQVYCENDVKLTNQIREKNMSRVENGVACAGSNGNDGVAGSNRRTLNLTLIDDDKGLEDEQSVVGIYTVVTGDSDAVAINQLVSEGQVTKDIEAHNANRAKIVDLDIRNRTGNDVMLRPIKLKDLRFEIK